MSVKLSRYSGTYDKKDMYCISKGNEVISKGLTEEDARVLAKKLGGDTGFEDLTEKLSVITGKTIFDTP